MEALYSKLYDRYNDMKTKKMTEMDRVNKDQEVEFMNYVSAAEVLIQHLKSENERLHSQVNNLRSEVASASFSEECSEYQKLWMEESQKNKVLSEEVERLQKLQEQSGFSNRTSNENRQENAPQTVSSALFDSSSARSKRRKLSATEAGKATHHQGSPREESAKEVHKQTVSTDTAVIVRPDSCRRTIRRSGDSSHDDDSANCVFQALVEYLVGMKFSVMTQNEGICVSAEHPSSGYSFSLTWLEKADGKELELKYHVVSLGTFERVAPEWMREPIMFSTAMCPIFFERVSRAVKLFS